MDLDHLLEHRRSVRRFAARPVEDHQLRAVLWAAQGRTSDGRRTTPSAAGRYPLHLVVARGRDPAGTWRWDPAGRALRPQRRDDVRDRLAAAAIGDQPWVASAPVTVALCAETPHVVEHFADQPPGDRGRRYVDIEVGAAVQNLALAATVHGLAGVILGGFDDAGVAEVFDVGADEPRLLFCLGHPA